MCSDLVTQWCQRLLPRHQCSQRKIYRLHRISRDGQWMPALFDNIELMIRLQIGRFFTTINTHHKAASLPLSAPFYFLHFIYFIALPEPINCWVLSRRQLITEARQMLPRPTWPKTSHVFAPELPVPHQDYNQSYLTECPTSLKMIFILKRSRISSWGGDECS